jgi:hypothetical protein
MRARSRSSATKTTTVPPECAHAHTKVKFIRALAPISPENNHLSTSIRAHAHTKVKFIRALARISPENNQLSTPMRAHAHTKMEFIRALARIKKQDYSPVIASYPLHTQNASCSALQSQALLQTKPDNSTLRAPDF